MELEVFDKAVYELVDPASPLEKLDTGFTFTEGPVYRNGVYYFTDFMVNKIFRRENSKTVLINDDSHYIIGMTYDPHKDRILCCARDLRAITTLEGEIIVNNYQGVPINGSNDVIVDRKGRIFFSDPLTRKLEGPQLGHSNVFMYTESTGELVLLDHTLSFPNGLALSPDEKYLYIVETNGLMVYKMDMTDRSMTRFVQFDQAKGAGKPDGMRLDERGNLYVTGPGGVYLVNPAGSILGLIRIPEIAANLCFDSLGIFITASKSIYRVDTKIPPAIKAV
ncbi:MAG: SMP-30/gluconolactonase/LRE family protein [Spirochaetaceae bacterium]|jgi:gluconolactonase|nr:SMP-30/gluconolactonase/LRE family protein [Spirochaetaceae bacterium]